MKPVEHIDPGFHCCHSDGAQGGGPCARIARICEDPSYHTDQDVERYASEADARKAGWQRLGRSFLCPDHRLQAADAMKTDKRWAES